MPTKYSCQFQRAHSKFFLSRYVSSRSTPSHSIYVKSILILSFHLRLGLPNGPSSSFPHQNSACTRATCSAHRILTDLIIQIVLFGGQIVKIIIMQFSLFQYLFVPLASTHFSQRLISERPYPMLSP